MIAWLAQGTLIGRHSITRVFWQCADREVGAARALLAAFDHVDGLGAGTSGTGGAGA